MYNLGSLQLTPEQISAEQNRWEAEQAGKFNAALAELSKLANRVYGYSHDAKVAKDLETVYADIIEDSPELADKSAVGFTAFLEDGDKIETQGNICYINGDLTDTDYTFSGENSEGGFEVCVVWYFENDGELNCISREFGLIDVIIKKSITEITSSEEFFAFSNSIETNVALTFAPYSTRKQRNIKGGIYHDKISLALEEYESNVSALTNTPTLITFNGSKALKKVRFPELTSVDGVVDLSHQIFADCSNLVIDDESFPKLETIGSSIAPAQWSMFKNVPTLILPESLTSVGSGVSLNNKVVVVKFRDATTVSENWCSSTPTERFEMVDDWGATINIAVAAANWATSDFIDLIFNKLRDVHASDGETLFIGADKHRVLAGNSIGNDEIALDGAWFYFNDETNSYQPYAGTVDTDDVEATVDGVIYRNPLRKAISLGWTVKN